MANIWMRRTNLPDYIEIGLNKFKCSTSFRNWIKFNTILKDKHMKDGTKLFVIQKILNLDDSIRNFDDESVFNALFSFYMLDKEPKLGNSSSDIPYDFEKDWNLIFSAFMQQYRINLLDVDMHWWEFKALFDSLTEDTKFVKIQGYRTQDISKLPNHMQSSARELKEYYRLSNDEYEKTPQEIEAELLKKAGVLNG